jgi:hypothetical protein
MNNAVEELRANSVRSIEQIMMDQVINYMDGLGPCTTVECLLNASVEASRIFILEKQMQGGDHGDYNDHGEHGGDNGEHQLQMLVEALRERFNPKNFNMKDAVKFLRNQIMEQSHGEISEAQLDMMMDMMTKEMKGNGMEDFVDGIRNMFAMMSNGDGGEHMQNHIVDNLREKFNEQFPENAKIRFDKEKAVEFVRSFIKEVSGGEIKNDVLQMIMKKIQNSEGNDRKSFFYNMIEVIEGSFDSPQTGGEHGGEHGYPSASEGMMMAFNEKWNAANFDIQRAVDWVREQVE